MRITCFCRTVESRRRLLSPRRTRIPMNYSERTFGNIAKPKYCDARFRSRRSISHDGKIREMKRVLKHQERVNLFVQKPNSTAASMDDSELLLEI